MSEQTASFDFAEALEARGVSRRSFLKFCGTLAVAAGLSASAAPRVAMALEEQAVGAKTDSLFPVIWIEGGSCTGCTESFAQIETPDVGKVVLELISLNYSDVLCAGAGKSIEEAKEKTIKSGKPYIVVYEGGIQTAFAGESLRVAGHTGVHILREAAKNAAAVVALGSCAVNGGWMAAHPNPAGAMGVQQVLNMGAEAYKYGCHEGDDDGKPIATPVVNVPGCPANPEWLMSILVPVLMMGGAEALVAGDIKKVAKLLDLNGEMKPNGIFGQTVHDNCERRGHFENGEFVYEFGSKEEALGYCLYPLGCKGPQTKSNCGVVMWNNRRSWCVQAGTPCIGCCEANPSNSGDNWVEVNTPFYERHRDLHIGDWFFQPTVVAGALTGIVAAALIIHGFGMKFSGRTDGGAPFEKRRAWDEKHPDQAIGQYEYSIYETRDPEKLKAAQEEIAKQYDEAEDAAIDTEEGR